MCVNEGSARVPILFAMPYRLHSSIRRRDRLAVALGITVASSVFAGLLGATVWLVDGSLPSEVVQLPAGAWVVATAAAAAWLGRA